MVKDEANNKEADKVKEDANLNEESVEEVVDNNLEEEVEVVEDETTDEMAELRREKIKLNSELDELKDKFLRLNAEYDNFRKRTAKEKESIYSDACADVLIEVLPVIDNLERALQVEGSCDDLKKGIEMTERQFKGALEKLGVTEIDSNGQFDPNYHNAVMHIEDENLEANTIAEVFQKGYKKGDKVIRYTLVKVAN